MKEVEDMTHKKLQGLGKEAQSVFFFVPQFFVGSLSQSVPLG